MRLIGRFIARLWRGELSLGAAFWDVAVIGALVVNLSTTFAFVLLIGEGLTLAAFVVGYACSVPYNLLAAVAVWRSAGRYQGPRVWPVLARALALPFLAVLSLL